MSRPTEPEHEAWIEECVSHLQDAESYDVVSAYANEFLLLYGVIARTMRFANGYLQLVRSGHGSEAVTLLDRTVEVGTTTHHLPGGV